MEHIGILIFFFFFILGKKQQITYKEILTFYFFIFSGDVKLPLEQKHRKRVRVTYTQYYI